MTDEPKLYSQQDMDVVDAITKRQAVRGRRYMSMGIGNLGVNQGGELPPDHFEAESDLDTLLLMLMPNHEHEWTLHRIGSIYRCTRCRTLMETDAVPQGLPGWREALSGGPPVTVELHSDRIEEL